MSLSTTRGGAVLAGLIAVLSILSCVGARAQGVSVAPSRIVLDGRTRSATVFLSNRGDRTETYRISMIPIVMREDGALLRADSTQIDQAAFAENVVRFSPRRVVIPAGSSQTVRLLVRRPRDRDVGDVEFRAHLSVCSIPTVPRLDELVEAPPEDLPEDQFVAKPVASIETLVPVVVRFGKPRAVAAIESPSFEKNEQGTEFLSFYLTREGSRSLYGQLTVTQVDPMGNKTELYHGRGLALYTPNERRLFRIPLGTGSRDLQAGRITIDFVESEDGGGDQEVHTVIQPGTLSLR